MACDRFADGACWTCLSDGYQLADALDRVVGVLRLDELVRRLSISRRIVRLYRPGISAWGRWGAIEARFLRDRPSSPTRGGPRQPRPFIVVLTLLRAVSIVQVDALATCDYPRDLGRDPNLPLRDFREFPREWKFPEISGSFRTPFGTPGKLLDHRALLRRDPGRRGCPAL